MVRCRPVSAAGQHSRVARAPDVIERVTRDQPGIAMANQLYRKPVFHQVVTRGVGPGDVLRFEWRIEVRRIAVPDGRPGAAGHVSITSNDQLS